MPNPIKKLLINFIRSNERRNNLTPVTQYGRGKHVFKLRVAAKHLLKDILLITLGIFSAGFGLEGFLLPSKFIDGGATGISLLVSEISSISLSVLLILVNLPFIFLGYRVISKQFAIKAALAITGLAIILATVHFPTVTHEKLLVAVFGGFFLGAGIGLTVRGGAVLDGTEILAIAISRRANSTIGDIIIIINIIVFSAAAYFLSIESALFSMITYLAASKTLDFVIEGIEEYTGITIISGHSDEIHKMIVNDLGWGVTIYKGKRGFGKRGHIQEMDIIYTIITRLEINKLNAEIAKIDPNAFIVTHSIKDTKGGMLKKRPFKD